ncbi:hypothetical protein N3K66_000713 [Trichothecium roseum]|uniref:Uncharacterized protein n=1 Tax=Trichothecium roseum TaxID=47278 RepID=A0ACC0VDA4_9HYPO|nr:hypothetical protein N3K66_000713 [Trichothecium roseum]
MTMATPSNPVPGTMKKLAPLPQGAKIQKRALTRRQPPSSSKSRVVYVSSSTPFMSAARRVRRRLDAGLREAEASSAPRGASLHARIEGLTRRDGGGDGKGVGRGATVTVAGTGKALEKVLGLAGWFEQAGDCNVELRTGTVGTVDDVIVEEGEDKARIRKVSCLELRITLK